MKRFCISILLVLSLALSVLSQSWQEKRWQMSGGYGVDCWPVECNIAIQGSNYFEVSAQYCFKKKFFGEFSLGYTSQWSYRGYLNLNFNVLYKFTPQKTFSFYLKGGLFCFTDMDYYQKLIFSDFVLFPIPRVGAGMEHTFRNGWGFRAEALVTFLGLLCPRCTVGFFMHI